MGLRQRSIRLRIFLLVLVPLLSLLGLYAFVASSTIGDARKAARAHTQLNSFGLPVLTFTQQMQTERRLAALYLATSSGSATGSASGTSGSDLLTQLRAQEAKTDRARVAMTEGLTSKSAQRTASTSAAQEAITQLLRDATALGQLRTAVSEHVIGPVGAVTRYSVLASDYYAFSTSLLSLSEPEIQLEGLASIRLGATFDALQQEDAIIEADALTGTFPAADRTAFAKQVGVRRQLLSDALGTLGPKMQSAYADNVNTGVIDSIVSFEDDVLSDPSPTAPQSVPIPTWSQDIAGLGKGIDSVLQVGADEAAQKTDAKAHSAYLRLGLAGGLGLLAVVLSLVISLRIGRRLARQLAELRRSASSLAREHLPSVMARLRAGEDVDVAAEAPLLKASPDEIGQVGQAFNEVQHAAVQAAVEQARLRRGVSDVFRNLARRSQSLLHRQLGLLDVMERRITDPDELGDLYRLDHLTTRMRRHAEGLIILSGAPIGRSWRTPVKLVDVLRAAVGEVEDYTRVNVMTMTQAALVGPAVADTIHLIAELVENATIFSPPNTPVRVTGDIVGNGFAVEIEDRGLGLSGEELAEVNNRLANPPEFDLSDSDQLGLFVAGRLAVRQGIQISMRSNAYGGSTVIVLIPRPLVIPEEAHVEGPAAVRAGAGDAAPQLTGRLANPDAAPDGLVPHPQQLPPPHPSELSRAGLVDPPPWPGDQAPANSGPPAASWPEPAPQPVQSNGSDPQPLNPRLPVPPEPAPAGPAGELAQPGGWGPGSYPPGPPAAPAPPPANPAPPGAELDELGLPRRVRQASLARQLRDSMPALPGADEPAVDRSPEQTRALMTAMQRGWERGRSDDGLPGPGAASNDNTTEGSTGHSRRPPAGGEHRRR